jgi:exopolyphosphatase / guanosine-5'-triphosphate,3'-diphosphate pyrophosphatase
MPELVALVDLGSNAARFLLVQIDRGVGYEVIYKKRVQTRLGGGAAGHLPVQAVDLTLSSVSRFLAGATNGTVPRVVAVATAAVRDAPNRDRLIEALRLRAGVDLRLLSGREEARLGALAAMQGLPFRDGVVADLGGGSLGLTRARGGRIVSSASVPLGAVRMTRRFLRDDPPSPREVRALRQEVRDEVLGALPPARRGDELLGIGGTVRTLARMHLATTGGPRRSRHGLRLQQSDVTAIREQLEALPLRKRRRLPGLKAERADIILAGAITIEELMVFGGYLALTVSKGGVRDGVLWRETFDGQS